MARTASLRLTWCWSAVACEVRRGCPATASLESEAGYASRVFIEEARHRKYEREEDVVMNFEPLMDALIDAVLFVGLGDDRIIDQDAAVGLLEGVAATLRELGPCERSVFVTHLQCRATEAPSDAERRTLLEVASWFETADGEG